MKSKRNFGVFLSSLLLFFISTHRTSIVFATEIQSNFFRGDSTAISILNGNTYLLSGSNLITYNHRMNTLTFEYKLVNAFRQLGYKRIFFTERSTDSPLTVALHKFQRKHDLPETDFVNSETMRIIDSELAQREILDYNLAIDYPPLAKFIESPINEPSKYHLAAMYSAFFSVASNIPNNPEPTWTIDDFRDSLVVGLGGNLGKMLDPEKTKVLTVNEMGEVMDKDGDFLFCAWYYDKFQDNGCINPNDTLFPYKIYEDILYIFLITHEYGHVISFQMKINLQGDNKQASYHFGKISWDMSGLDEWLSSNRLLRETTIAYDPKQEFVSTYAMSNSHEDFAESFVAYIQTGNIFRERVKHNTHLQQKYNFLKENIFQDREFATGNLESYFYYIARHNPRDIPYYPLAYLIEDPNWVWDYQYPLYTPPCPNKNLGNLSCDNQAFIDEADLTILLENWGSAETDISGDRKSDSTDLEILLSNWRPQ